MRITCQNRNFADVPPSYFFSCAAISFSFLHNVAGEMPRRPGCFRLVALCFLQYLKDGAVYLGTKHTLLGSSVRIGRCGRRRGHGHGLLVAVPGHGASFIRSTREMSLSRISLPFAITTSLSMTLRNSLILPGK